MKIAELVSIYIAFKQNTGMRFRAEAGTLRAFARSMGDVDISEVGPEAVRAFIAGNGPITAFWHQKYKILNCFYRFAIARGFAEISPLPDTVPQRLPSMTPYIYSTEELRALLAATGKLHNRSSPLQARTIRALLLVLYSTGMRIGEALSLTLEDVDIGDSLVTVREAKFYKTRLVPIGPKLTAELAAYARARRKLPLPAGEGSAFFVTRTGHRLSYERVNELFGRVRALAGVRREDSARYQPRLHDLRHTAAVHRVILWYRQGKDVQRLLPQLATYLGHVDIVSSQRYLSMTSDLLQEASSRFEHYARPETEYEGKHVDRILDPPFSPRTSDR